MSKQSRARAAATDAKALPAGKASLLPETNAFLARWGVFLAGGVIVFAALAAYYNSFSGPFVYDDVNSIAKNPTIHQIGSALSPPPNNGVGGRPVLNLTFALNYALGGLNVWGYHAFNLIVHVLAGLTLFGVVRRTLLERPRSNIQHPTSKANRSLDGAQKPRAIPHGLSPGEALPLALAVAVIWVVHPLQTEAVTYISQRAESLMGLFYLLTLYCFIRGAECRSGFTPDIRLRQAYGGQASGINPDLQEGLPVLRRIDPRPSTLTSQLWLPASILSCLLGATIKEVIVTAPVIVLLYDRTFVAGSFREAWRSRWRYYLGLTCTWLLLARLMMGLNHRGVGFEQGITWWNYALTSCRSVALYLKLAVWPHPLVLDYGTDVIQHVTEVAPYALLLAGLITATAIALWRRPVLGFAGAWFFVILAPASSVIPVAGQPTAEHRMYLPLAAGVAWVVVGLYRLIGRRSFLVFAAAAVGLGWLSAQRNQDYRSELSIWSDTVAKCPDNERALYNLGCALGNTPNRMPEAIAAYEAALRIRPDHADAHNNLGNALLKVPGRLPDAIVQFEMAVWLKPRSVEMHDDFGGALLKLPDRLPDAIAQYEAALQIDPNSAEAHYDLGYALLKMPGRLPDAMAEFETALRINPDYAEAHNNLGDALRAVPGRLPDAIDQFEAALRINPGLVDAQISLGNALLKLPGRRPDAMAHLEAAVRLDPDSAMAHYDLGNAFAQSGLWPDAIAQYEAALRINPDSVAAHYNLGNTLLKMPGRLPDAIDQYKEALRLKPDLAPAREMLERLQGAEP